MMMSISTGDFAWKEIGDLEWNSPDPDTPVFTDSRGRNFVLCKVLLYKDGSRGLSEVKETEL